MVARRKGFFKGRLGFVPYLGGKPSKVAMKRVHKALALYEGLMLEHGRLYLVAATLGYILPYHQRFAIKEAQGHLKLYAKLLMSGGGVIPEAMLAMVSNIERGGQSDMTGLHIHVLHFLKADSPGIGEVEGTLFFKNKWKEATRGSGRYFDDNALDSELRGYGSRYGRLGLIELGNATELQASCEKVVYTAKSSTRADRFDKTARCFRIIRKEDLT